MPAPQSIAHFRITGPLGEGGMGVVYRATDTKLNREVALKVLTPEFANDPDRLARFTREAQILAGLNHPNIAAVYGVESNALILELVDGPTLAEHIAQGPTQFDEALPLIRQLIDAIEYAHEKGVIHRDLKPQNIKLTPGGRVKVLDFGLAKAFSNETTPSHDPANSPTLTMRPHPTQTGLILGTAAYMAPEQACGKTVDKRADIWAFGVIVYELLTAKRLFQGETAGDILAQTLTKQIDLASVPAQARKLLQRCLDRDPLSRLRDIGDARHLFTEPDERKPQPSRLPWLLAAAGLACGLAGLSLWLRSPRPNPSPPLRMALDSTAPTFLSPDGARLFVQDSPDEPLRFRRLDELNARLLPGTEKAAFPFWSADSSAIGFFQNEKLRSINLSSLEIRTHAPAPHPNGAAWRGDASSGEIVYASAGKLQLLDIAAGQSRPIPLSLPPNHTPSHPLFLPESQDSFLVLAGLPDASRRALYRASLRGGALDRLFETPSQVHLAPNPHNGAWHLVYHGPERRNLMTVTLDPSAGTLTGHPRQLTDSIGLYNSDFFITFSASRTGSAVWRRSVMAEAVWGVRWRNRKGEVLSSIDEKSKVVSSMALSPDENRVALRTGSFPQEIWIFDSHGGPGRRLVSSLEDVDGAFVWSPDSKWLYYARPASDDKFELVRHAVSGGIPPEVISRFSVRLRPQSVTLDGRYLFLTARGSGWGIFRIDLSHPVEPEHWLPPSEDFTPKGQARLMPDGKWLVVEGGYFVSTGPDRRKPEIVRANLAVNTPFISPDGKEVCGIAPRSIWTVECQPITRNSAGQPGLGPASILFTTRSMTLRGSNVGAIAHDGRILLIDASGADVLNYQYLSDWASLLPASPK